ncbi:MAG TPA: G/U mismatch-specific DNA glycosylase [Burkholderiales bacterium]|nr:G/U mismatch-specific DNA glycosylase [Burkholderiales bacterium]
MGSPTSSRKPRRRVSSSSKPTRNPAATWSGRPSPDALRAAAGKGLRDVIGPGLKVLFCGINPGLYSAATGFHFARPGNRFWPALHGAGFTPRLFAPCENERLLELGFGLTNLVNRGTAAADELSPAELVAGGRKLAAKVRRYRPRAVAFVGLGAYRTAFSRPKATLGLQAEPLEGADVWVLPSPSGLNANYQLPQLVQRFRQLWQRSSTNR